MDGTLDVSLPLELQSLSNLLEEFPETLALGNQDLQATALNATKYVFDLSIQSEASSKCHVVELMSSLSQSQAPQTRSRANTETEKPQSPDKNIFDSTRLISLYIDGMDEEQIWEQLDLRTKTICRVLDFVLEGELEEEEQTGDTEGEDEDETRLLKALEDLEGEGIDMDELVGEESESSSGQSSSQTNSPTGSDLEDEEGEENYSSLRDPSEDEDEDSDVEPPVLHSPNQSPSRRKRSRHAAVSELDDDFFSLAEFNAEAERAEARSSSKGRLAEDDESDEDMDIDLFAHVDPIENFEEDDLKDSPNVLFYKDFFIAPPLSAAAKTKSKVRTSRTSRTNQVRFHDQVRVKKIKPNGKNKSLYEDDGEDDSLLAEDDDDGAEVNINGMEWNEEEEEMEEEEEEEEEEESDNDENEENPRLGSGQTIERLKHDLFAEEEEEVQDDLTMHERRMATLRDQIVELESENVAKKDWVLMGEAGSRQRPQNSLLEEDLEFDRVMKALPVITEEAVLSLEETIKARILEGRFDDVVRLRPLDDKPFLPSKFFELQDSKSTQSLAQIYENEYTSAQSGVSSDDRDGKLRKEHDEISQLWEKICGKLDALCNAHFVPKQPKATISTIANVATATLESALPTSKSTATMLAPEEIFAPSPSLQRARSELTPVEKRALRTRERKARQRQRNALDNSLDKYAKATGRGSVKRQKEAALKSVVKHGKGVTVVGKKVAKDNRRKT